MAVSLYCTNEDGDGNGELGEEKRHVYYPFPFCFFSCSLFCLCFFTCVRAENGDWVLFCFVFISLSFIFPGFLECVVDIMAKAEMMRGGVEAEMVSRKAEQVPGERGM